MRIGITVDSTPVVYEEDSVHLNSRLSPRSSQAEFTSLSGVVPAVEDEVAITRADTPYQSAAAAIGLPALGGESTYINNFFGGYISDVEYILHGIDLRYRVSCYDYQRRLEDIIVDEDYSSQTEAYIIEDLFGTYWSDVDDETYVTGTETITSIQFPRITLAEALNKLAELNSRTWYLDYDKKLHYFTAPSETAPFELSDTPNYSLVIPYSNFRYTISRPTINRITVVGRDGAGDDIVETRTDSDSYTLYGKYFDGKYVDRNINTSAWAQAVGDAILEAEANAKEHGSFNITQEGLVVGQQVAITNSKRGVDDNYLIQSIDLRMVGELLPDIRVSYGDYMKDLTERLADIAREQTKEG
jgi:hypothetical protein